MKITLDSFRHKILNLKDKNQYSKEELLNEDFLIKKEKNVEIYYAAHNEYINKDAKIFIVSITPGWLQMERSIYTARKCLTQNMNYDEIAKICKIECRLYGTSRSNTISMLNELKLNNYLGIEDCEDLFRYENTDLHTTSIIKHPVFINKENYNGHNPKILKSNILREYVYNDFLDELEKLNEIFIIPLGKSVEEVMKQLIKEKIINENQCLFGFPHPSGANGHRKTQFNKNKESMMEKLSLYFKE
jgi:hypothetical protein